MNEYSNFILCLFLQYFRFIQIFKPTNRNMQDVVILLAVDEKHIFIYRVAYKLLYRKFDLYKNKSVKVFFPYLQYFVL